MTSKVKLHCLGVACWRGTCTIPAVCKKTFNQQKGWLHCWTVTLAFNNFSLLCDYNSMPLLILICYFYAILLYSWSEVRPSVAQMISCLSNSNDTSRVDTATLRRPWRALLTYLHWLRSMSSEIDDTEPPRSSVPRWNNVWIIVLYGSKQRQKRRWFNVDVFAGYGYACMSAIQWHGLPSKGS